MTDMWVLDQQKIQEQVHNLLLRMPQTNLQLEADKPKDPEISMPEADVPKKGIKQTATSPGS